MEFYCFEELLIHQKRPQLPRKESDSIVFQRIGIYKNPE